MPATVDFRSFHGATPDSGTNIVSGTVRFKAADNDTADTVAPVVIPESGTAYSFVKQFRFVATSTPPNLIDSLKFYSDGANSYGTGVALGVKAFTPLTGTATSGTNTTLTKSAAGFGTLTGYVLEITGGTGSGQARRILSNTATVITVASAFSVALDNTSQYRIGYLDPVTQAQTALTGTADAFGYTAGSPLALAGSLSNPSTGAFGDFVQVQLAVSSSASQGPVPTENFTVSYDEA